MEEGATKSSLSLGGRCLSYTAVLSIGVPSLISLMAGRNVLFGDSLLVQINIPEGADSPAFCTYSRMPR